MIKDVKFYMANEDGTYDPIGGRIETMEISYVNVDYETKCFSQLSGIFNVAEVKLAGFVDECILAGAENNRVRHLALHSKKKRVRKKNRSRAFESIWG